MQFANLWLFKRVNYWSGDWCCSRSGWAGPIWIMSWGRGSCYADRRPLRAPCSYCAPFPSRAHARRYLSFECPKTGQSCPALWPWAPITPSFLGFCTCNRGKWCRVLCLRQWSRLGCKPMSNQHLLLLKSWKKSKLTREGLCKKFWWYVHTYMLHL